MRGLLAIAAKDLKLRLRDRSVFITALAAPLVLSLIFNFVFGGALSGDAEFEPAYGIVAPGSPRSEAILGGIAGEIGSDPVTYSNVEEAETGLESGEVEAVFVLAAGFDQALALGEAGRIEVVGEVDAPTATQVASAIAASYGLGLEAIQLSVAAGVAAGGDPAVLGEAAGHQGRGPVTIGNIEAAVRQLDGTTFAVAGMAVFFLMFTAQFGLKSLLDERRDGTLARILATPTSPAAVLGAKTLVSVILGLISMGVLLIAGSVLMGARWGDPLAVAALVGAAVLAAVAITALIAGMAKTPEAAESMHSVVAVTLGLMGGTFFPIGQQGGVLARLTALTPHHWFLRGLADLAGGGGLSVVVPAVGWLLVIATAFGVVAWWVMTRQAWR
jgi:ABC-2 type transport system permease protein